MCFNSWNPYFFWQRRNDKREREKYSRLFVEHHESQQISEVFGPEGLPLYHDLIAHGSDQGKLQRLVLAWENRHAKDKETSITEDVIKRATAADDLMR